MQTRRAMMADGARLAALLAAAGMLPAAAQASWNEAAFDARTLADAVKVLGGSTPQPSAEVAISGPDVAEDGSAVPIGISTSLAGARRLLLLVEKNPVPLAAVFELTDAVDAAINTRVKMGQSSDVYAVAMTADGGVRYARKEIRVTLGGCGA